MFISFSFMIKRRRLRSETSFTFWWGITSWATRRISWRFLKDGDFRYKVIGDAGHGVNHEQPEIINREIISFLQEQETQV